MIKRSNYDKTNISIYSIPYLLSVSVNAIEKNEAKFRSSDNISKAMK